MKVLVIGLGSMGKRRIRLLKILNPHIDIIGVDKNIERTHVVQKEYGINVSNNLEEILENCNSECAIVSTSPLSHASIINKCLQTGLHVFSELNLVSDLYSENIYQSNKKGLILFLSSTFLYRKEVQYIMNEKGIAGSNINYSYHVGQYLPDWHPWETYNDFFVGEKKTNGCRELFAIELPWLIKTFGQVNSFNVMKSKSTSLDINYMDNYILLLEHMNGNKGMLAVDVMSRKAVRNLEVFGEEIYLSWDGTPYGLKKYDIKNKKYLNINLYNNIDQSDKYSSFIIENAYKNELAVFLDAVYERNSAGIKYTFQEDLQVLKLIDNIEGIN